jgi:hypothetical protein
MEKKINEGIMIFKDTFEYLIDGDLDEMQFCELMRLIYQARFGNGVELDDIKDKFVKSIWRTLRHSVARSTTNAKQYAKKIAKKEAVTNDNTPSGISNQTTKDNGSESLKMANTMDISNEFAIPTPEVDEPTEIDDTGDFYFEWQTECERLIKDAMIDTLEGNGYAMRECNNKLQEIYNVCVANGCSEVLLSQIKDSVKERVSNEVDKEYN